MSTSGYLKKLWGHVHKRSILIMKNVQKHILVTRSYVPPINVYTSYLRRVWKSRWLTNEGELVQELEQKLERFFGVKHVAFVSNGTIALQLAFRALDLDGDVITTPFTYVATSAALLWEHLRPVFVDIKKNTLCLDTTLVEEAVTKKTKAILAVHVYGIPCDVQKIEKIAQKHDLKVIYDAAHAFGTTVGKIPIARFGDITTFSFHATKLFHTAEGGAVVTNNDALFEKIIYLRSFGHLRGDHYHSLGINAKNSELHAAMGLSVLPHVRSFIIKRKKIFAWYDDQLNGFPIERPKVSNSIEYNYAYYPAIFENERILLAVKKKLESHDIFPRRYFYPSLNTIPFITSGVSCPVSEDVSKRVLCFPLYNDIRKKDVIRITNIVKKVLIGDIS